jgi:hypothetical protein
MLGFSSRWDMYDFLKRENAERPFGEVDLESEAIAQSFKGIDLYVRSSPS